MPERAINTKSATGCLLILLPAALAMSALFVAWPFILGVTLLLAGGNIWQSYAWSKTAQSIDPVFQQLIVQNRGEISPIDLSLSAQISGKVSQRYLATKANEFGTGSRQHPDRGQIYYFVSVRTLGNIFDDSELDLPAIEPAPNSVAVMPSAPTLAKYTPEILVPITATPPIAEVAEIAAPVPHRAPPATPTPVADLSNLRQLLDDEKPAPIKTPATVEPVQLPVAVTPTVTVNNDPTVTIIQSELAKRLDVHSSTIYKRRSEPDFTDWTRNRDPEGFAWGYAEASKEYYRIDT
jgi:hypothetical protein